MRNGKTNLMLTIDACCTQRCLRFFVSKKRQKGLDLVYVMVSQTDCFRLQNYIIIQLEKLSTENSLSKRNVMLETLMYLSL